MRRHPWIGATTDDGFEAPGYLSLLTELALTDATVYGAAPVHGLSSQGTSWRSEKNENSSAGYWTDIGGANVRVLNASPATVAHHICGLASERRRNGVPACLVAGVNYGPNVGEHLIHSGTFGAALVGAWLGFPSVAVSLDDVWSVDEANPGELRFARAARVARLTIEWVLELGHPVLCNVNVPNSIDRNPVLVEAAIPGGFAFKTGTLREDKSVLSDGVIAITVFGPKSLETSEALSLRAAASVGEQLVGRGYGGINS